jgi:hypothetical protein
LNRARIPAICIGIRNAKPASTCNLLNSQQEHRDGVQAGKLRVFAFGMEVFATEQCFSAWYVRNKFFADQ